MKLGWRFHWVTCYFNWRLIRGSPVFWFTWNMIRTPEYLLGNNRHGHVCPNQLECETGRMHKRNDLEL